MVPVINKGIWMTFLFRFVFCPLSLLLTGCGQNDWRMNMRAGVTPISHQVYELHMAALWICVAIAVVVFGAMFYALFYHRKSRGAEAAHFHEHTSLEITWAIIPFLILLVMAIPATKILMFINDPSKADLTIKITGYQWKWEYEYLDQGIKYFSNISTPQNQMANQVPKGKWYLLEVDKPLVVPINKKIRFLLTANDVIHSWWVPELGIKRDALPGFINEAWAIIQKPGVYRGQCAELCGVNHAFMPIVVQAVSEDDFNQWVQQQAGQQQALGQQQTATAPITYTKDQLMAKGQQLYLKTCAVCHKDDGTGMPPAFPPIKGSKIATNEISAHINIVMDGKPGTAMQAFAPQLSDADLAAVITYQRNAWGNDLLRKNNNNNQELVEPADIAQARKK